MEKIGVYIHIPFCESRCTYCDFVSSIFSKERVERYVDAISHEIQLFAEIAKIKYQVDTVYFGGGTPSILPAECFKKIANSLKKNFVCEIKEWTVECNPNTINQKKLSVYKACGVTRISLGAQTLNDDILKTIGRAHSAKQVIDAVRLCKKYDFEVSVDAMLGLPFQKMSDIDNFAIAMTSEGVEHISAYMLTVEAKTVLALQVKENKFKLPSDDESADMYDEMLSILRKNGLERYEVSNFATSGHECLHNLKYWQCQPYIGFGLSAHSMLSHERFFNPSDFEGYYAKIENNFLAYQSEESLSDEDMLNEKIMLAFRLSKGVDIDEINSKFKIDFMQKYKEAIAKNKDFLDISDNFIAIKADFMNRMNSIIIDFI